MIGDEENINYDLNSKEKGFRYYKIIVKIMNNDQIHHQNIEIYTTGLRRLLEMRRIHNLFFNSAGNESYGAVALSN